MQVNVYKLVIMPDRASLELWERECHGWAFVYLQGATPTVTILRVVAGVHLAHILRIQSMQRREP
jgi:hypothetical protein